MVADETAGKFIAERAQADVTDLHGGVFSAAAATAVFTSMRYTRAAVS
jgi:hypothetical protein